MIRMQVYFPEDLKRELDFLAKSQEKPAAEVIRLAVRREVEKDKKRKLGPGATLLKIATYAKKGSKRATEDFFDYAYGKKSSYSRFYEKKSSS